MTSLTSIVTILFSVAALFVPPVYCLVVFVAGVIWYPNYLKLNLFGADLTVCRILILVILVRIIMRGGRQSRLRLTKLDKTVMVVFACQIIAGVMTAPSAMDLIVNRFGAIFDMLLPYFAVRLLIRSKQDYVKCLVGNLIVMAPLALLGLYQSMTGYNVFYNLESAIPWRVRPSEYGKRLGLTRANLSFANPIIYGLIYAMFTTLIAGLWYRLKKYRSLLLTGLICMVLGVFSCLSSGGFLAALVGVGFLFCYRFRKYWKLVLITFIVGLLCVEILSNRHWYHVFCDFTLNKSTSWYRGRLMEMAISEGGMTGHWVAGYGYGVDPNWGVVIDGRPHTDMANHYLLILVEFGLIGLIPFLWMNVLVVQALIKAWKKSGSLEDRFIVWSLAAVFLALGLTSFSTSLIGPPSTIYYMMVGFVGCLPAVVIKRKLRRPPRKIIKLDNERELSNG